MFSQKIQEILNNGSRKEIKALCEYSLSAFAVTYFPEFFKYKSPFFHQQIYQALELIADGRLSEAAFIMFRESAKTSICKIFVVWCIVYNKKKYINWDAYSKDNAEQALFDIALWLQTNDLIRRDFGRLYHKKVNTEEDEPKLRRISNFITDNDIKVEAFSTQESTRGRVYKENRPDLYILDDFETSKTKDSIPTMRKIIGHIDELKAGLGPNGAIIYNGNYITEIGVVDHVMKSVENNPRGVVLNVPIMNKAGEIAWPDKYVKTDAEAGEINKTITDPEKRKVSIEERRRMLNANGRKVFESEMMNDPVASGERFFDKTRSEDLLRNSQDPIEEKSGLRIYKRYNPSHRYAVGGDTSMGVGRDSNAAVMIDFSVIPALVVTCYDNNQIAPDIFAHEMKREGKEYGECLLAPEVNSQSGGTCINELKKIYPLEKIYRRVQNQERLHNKVTDKIGWETNNATRPEMFYQLKSAIEDGKLVSYDKKLNQEIKTYTQTDLIDVADPAETTRHFDLLTAACIAWMMKDYALLEPARKESTYVQPAPESNSFYNQ